MDLSVSFLDFGRAPDLSFALAAGRLTRLSAELVRDPAGTLRVVEGRGAETVEGCEVGDEAVETEGCEVGREVPPEDDDEAWSGAPGAGSGRAGEPWPGGGGAGSGLGPCANTG